VHLIPNFKEGFMLGKLPVLSKAAITLLAAILLPFLSLAQQQPFEISWRNGQVTLATGDTISGQITLSHPNDIVRVTQENGVVSAFSAVNVKSFSVQHEQGSGIFRRSEGPQTFKRNYQSFLWNHDKDYSNFKSPAFFVVLQPGKNTLLMREVKERYYDNAAGSLYGNSRMAMERIREKFYLLTPNQEIKPLRNPKKDLPEFYGKKGKQVLTYAKENKLSFTEPVGLAMIVNYANSLP
jgi:hypothetical protein